MTPRQTQGRLRYFETSLDFELIFILISHCLTLVFAIIAAQYPKIEATGG